MAQELIRTIAILGAGSGGCAAAADLTLRGFEVRLHARREERLEPIRRKGGIEMTGGLHQGFVALRTLTTRVAEAVEGSDLIMIVVPAMGLSYYAQELASIMSRDMIVFLNPGQTGGGLHFVRELRRAGYDDEVRTCETASLTQVCRLESPTHVHVPGYKRELAWSAFPGMHANSLFDRLRRIYPHIVCATNVMETGLANLNVLVHPAGMVMNAGWIEHTTGDFYFYREGFTEAVSRVAAAMDAERLQIGDALGVVTRTMLEMSRDTGIISDADFEAGNISEAWRRSELPASIRSPKTLDDRYIHEDVGYGLVPMSALGASLGVPTPTIDAVIHLASLAVGVPFRETGLTLERMGLLDVRPSDLHRFLWEGE